MFEVLGKADELKQRETACKEAINNILEGKNVIDLVVKLLDKNGDNLKVEFSAITKGNTLFWFAKKALVQE